MWSFLSKSTSSWICLRPALTGPTRTIAVIFATAIEHFAASGHRWLDLGAGAGIGGPASDGLARFKQGWSTGTRTVFFCGRIFDSAKYREIVEARRVPETSYFPAYRRGEFGA